VQLWQVEGKEVVTVNPDEQEDVQVVPCKTFPLRQLVHLSYVPEQVKHEDAQVRQTELKTTVYKLGQLFTQAPLYKYCPDSQLIQVEVDPKQVLQLESHSLQ